MQSTVPNGTSTLTTRLLLDHVRSRGGEAAVTRVLTRCDVVDDRERLEKPWGRVPYDVKLRLFDAAVEELGDPGLGRRLAAQAMDDVATATLRVAIRALGSPEMVLRNVARISARFESAAVMTCEQSGPGFAVLSWQVLPPHRPNRVECDYNIGYVEQAPVLFGLPAGQVEELTCQLDGHDRCRYVVRWSPRRRRWWRRPVRRDVPEALATLNGQVQSFQEAATDLVGGHGITETLDRIAERAGDAVNAAGHALVVRLAGGLHVRHVGLPPQIAEQLVDGLAAGRRDAAVDGWPVVAADVLSSTSDYGTLVAVARPGQGFFPDDAALLSAYARHAAAALDTATALGRAREQEETARMLLDVARSLSQRRTVDEVLHSVAAAVPGLTGADRAAVALWDADQAQLRVGAFSGWPTRLWSPLEAFLTTPGECPELAAVLTDHKPVLVDGSSSAFMIEVLGQFELQGLAAVPIRIDGAFLGVVLASWADVAPPVQLTTALVERLSGLAGQAAVALDNARLLDQVHQQALHDTTTGLGNRLLLQHRLTDAIAAGGDVAVLFCDLDRFKRVNDTLGHAAGDELLRQVAARLRDAVRDTDTVVRFSGDEFVVICPDIGDAAQSQRAADRVSSCFRTPFAVGDEQVFVGASVGVALCDGSTVDGRQVQGAEEAADAVIALADQRMYQVKHQRRNDGVARGRAGDLLRLEGDLHGAIQRGELTVQYQPQVELRDGRATGVEALVRWHHPTRGLIPPGVFIPLAEESGLIAEVGDFVLRTACAAAAGWRRAGIDLAVSVNTSPVEIDRPGYVDAVLQVLEDAGMDPRRLTVEVTETHVVDEGSQGRRSLDRLRRRGIGVSVDDFGTGYASLAQLRRLPVTELKIDRSFMAEVDGTTASAGFVAGVVGLARGLRLQVVAEGVETVAQLRTLADLDCHRVQGYLLSRPVDADDVVAACAAAAARARMPTSLVG